VKQQKNWIIHKEVGGRFSWGFYFLLKNAVGHLQHPLDPAAWRLVCE
jgi:hypothetical protein